MQSKGSLTMPTKFHARKHVRFVDLPRHKRRKAVIRLGWKISQQSDGLSFWTDHLLKDPDDPHRVHRWVDVYFLGADRFALWNAEFITTQMAVEDEIHSLAFEAVYAALSADEIKREFAFENRVIPPKRPGAPRLVQWVPRPDRQYAQFEGRTFNQECERLEALYLATDAPVIGERFVTDRSYAYGIGLHAVVDEVTFDGAAIERTIQRFRDLGECDWRAA